MGPTSDGSRLFAALFMLAGVGGTAKLFADLAAVPLQRYQARMEAKVLHQYGHVLEEDELWELAASQQMQSLGLCSSMAYVTRNEFCLAMLVRMDKITPEDLKRCQEVFDRLDADGSGRLDALDIRAHQRHNAG